MATCGKKKKRKAARLKTDDQIFAEKTLALYNEQMAAYAGPGLPPSTSFTANGAGVTELGHPKNAALRWLSDHSGAAAQHARDVFGTSESFGIGSCGSLYMRKDITLGGYRTRFCLVGHAPGPHRASIMLDATFRPEFIYPHAATK